ncbi:MAG: hypothetical protein LBV50_10685 [Novosphingobium sp.]|nr:hypothetical protein [Novosphingobium sp.]
MAVIGAIVLAIGAMPTMAAAVPARAPSLAACAKPKMPNTARERKRPLPVPAGLRAIVKADLDHYAIATLGGGTVCVDTSWMESMEGFTGSQNGRFLSFGWHGYEAFGHMFIDRAGRGQAVDTGVAPSFSPSRALMAAVEISESTFGSLNAFAVWRIEASGVREIGRVEDLPSMFDWRIDRWAGESCIALSALPLDAEEARKAPRTRFVARPKGRGWSVGRGTCPSA